MSQTGAIGSPRDLLHWAAGISLPALMHFLRSLIFVALFCLASLVPEIASAQNRGFGPDPARAPSVFAYGFRGLGIGAPVGLSTAYLLTRDGDWRQEDWETLAIGTGIGAVSGAVVGLAVGFYDLRDSHPGVGMVVLRDTFYGVLLGAGIGLIVGSIYWIESGHAESALAGAAWGTVIGAPVGAIIGFIEGPTVRDSAQTDSAPNYGFHLQALRSRPAVGDVAGRVTLVPTFSGTF